MHVDRLHTFGSACAKFYFLSPAARARAHIHATPASPNLMAASICDLATFSGLHFSTQRHLLSAPPPKPFPPTRPPTCPPIPLPKRTVSATPRPSSASRQSLPQREGRKKTPPKLQKQPPPAARLHLHPPRSDHNSSREGGQI